MGNQGELWTAGGAPQSKTCRGCKVLKPLTEFDLQLHGKSGRTAKCRACEAAACKAAYHADPIAAREGARTRQRNYRKRHPERIMRQREARLIKAYGMTLDQYAQMLDAQDGRCAICGSANPGAWGAFHVDHDHATGKIRGLLCNRCNPAIGAMGDDPELLEKAVQYLRRHKSKSTLRVI